MAARAKEAAREAAEGLGEGRGEEEESVAAVEGMVLAVGREVEAGAEEADWEAVEAAQPLLWPLTTRTPQGASTVAVPSASRVRLAASAALHPHVMLTILWT